MTNTATATTWIPERDSYGRSCHRLYGHTASTNWGTLGIVCRLPKVYIETYGKARSYLVNDWTAPRPAGVDLETAGIVTYHPTLAAAKAHLIAVAR